MSSIAENRDSDVTRGRMIVSRQARFYLAGAASLIMAAVLLYMFFTGAKSGVGQEEYVSTPGRAFNPPRLPPVVHHVPDSTKKTEATLPPPDQGSVVQRPIGYGSVTDTSTAQYVRPAPAAQNQPSSNDQKGDSSSDPQVVGTSIQQQAHIGRASIGKRFNMHLLLRRNTMFHCILEQPINTSVPGPLTCTAADDVMSADGTVVLIEKGAAVNGEVMNSPVDGEEVVFIGFDEIITQDGLPIYLNGSGGDTLGTSGVPGVVNEHLWRKLKSALLLTAIQTGSQMAQSAAQKSGTSNINLNGSSGESMGEQALQRDLNIPASLYDPQAKVITVTVRQDIPFDGVYRLRARD